MHDEDRDREQRDDAELEEGREVIAWRKQQPHRKNSGQPAVDNDERSQWNGRVVEPAAQQGTVIDPAAGEYAEEHQGHAQYRSFDNPPRPPAAQVEADEDCDRDRREHRGRSPRAVLHRVDDHERQHRDENDHDQQRADQRGKASDGPELIARHLPEAAAVAPRRQEEDHHVLHATAQDRTDQDPQRTRQIAELRCQRRADQRSGTRDGREVMPERDPTVRRHEIAAVVEAFGRRCTRSVDGQDARSDPGSVEPVAEKIDAHGSGDDPQSVDRLVPMQRYASDGKASDHRQQHPKKLVHEPLPPASTFMPCRRIAPSHRAIPKGSRRHIAPTAP